MGTLYLDRRNLDLTLQSGQLVIREPADRPRTVPLHLLERVVVVGRTRLDTGLLAELGERGVTVVCLGGRRLRRHALVHGIRHNDARRRMAQYRLLAEPELRLPWARRIVRAKLRAQLRLQLRGLRNRPDLRRALTRSADRLRALTPGVAVSDLGSLLGLEGAGAAAHYTGLAALLPDSAGFRGRNRRPPRDPGNAALSLGYTLLHGEALIACLTAGLDPLLGVYHEPAYGRESLACDLMEPLRPHLDAWVWGMFRERRLRPEHFRQDGAACLLDKAGRQHFYAGYETAAGHWRRYLRRAAQLYAGWLAGLAPELPEAR